LHRVDTIHDVVFRPTNFEGASPNLRVHVIELAQCAVKMANHIIDLVQMRLFAGVDGIAISVAIPAVFVLSAPLPELALIQLYLLETFI
jgi:hypothetical protein